MASEIARRILIALDTDSAEYRNLEVFERVAHRAALIDGVLEVVGFKASPLCVKIEPPAPGPWSVHPEWPDMIMGADGSAVASACKSKNMPLLLLAPELESVCSAARAYLLAFEQTVPTQHRNTYLDMLTSVDKLERRRLELLRPVQLRPYDPGEDVR